ncbi:ATP-grasp domain-containing protein [Actinacidiphila sp. ITFR-21]|uniref:ATP-grasp domain-containing protein n=1 Tax=Actinacidiphila sp. ITFR-21 TaxID=3075199 RepID=UPI002889B2BA|nr:ATP-grasp domain-containing protein [Streptomyces sp. ITFR-21]WNI14312.1 ATP-grasp domain-containing protein [Streptomyces sp. ITFR-21]
MNPDRTLLIVGGKLKIVQKARRLGLDVVHIQLKEQYGPAHGELVAGALLGDYTDWRVLRPLAAAAHEAWGFGAAVSLTEPGLDPVGRVNDLLELGGTSYEVSHRFTDKWLMRRHLAEQGLPGPAAARITGRADLAAFGAAHGYPFIVKPVAVTASFGVVKVTGEEQLDPVWAHIEDLRRTGANQWARFFPVGDFIAEEFLDGPEYSVEGFSFAGRHVVVAVTEKAVLDTGFVELGHALPARLEPAVEQAVVTATTDFLTAMGLTDGPTHTEIKLTGRGPVVIESHNRVGGDRINEMVHAAYGIDLDTYAVGWPFRLVDELPDRPEPLRSAATRFLIGRPGTVTAVHGVEDVRADPAVVALDFDLVPGDVVNPLRGNWDRIGQLVATGGDTSAAIAACERLLGAIDVATGPEA